MSKQFTPPKEATGKKVIVFGATGNVGSYTALELKAHGYNVVAVGRRLSDNGFFADHDIPYYSVDIRRKESFRTLPRDIDTVVYFAGAMPAHMRDYNPYEYVDSIVTGTMNVLEWMRETGARKIVFSQSISDVLYKFGSDEPIDDDTERRFPLTGDHSVYSICKNAAVNLIEHYHAQYGISRFILRLPTIYAYHPSPYYYVNGEKRWMAYRYIIDQAMRGNTLEIWGDPKAKKEMVYIRDFTQLVHRCVESTLDGGIYNAGCGRPISIEDQIRDIAEVFARDRKSDIVYRPDKPSSPQFTLSIDKARRELGYEPQYDFYRLLVDFKKEMEVNTMRKLHGEAM